MHLVLYMSSAVLVGVFLVMSAAQVADLVLNVAMANVNRPMNAAHHWLVVEIDTSALRRHLSYNLAMTLSGA